MLEVSEGQYGLVTVRLIKRTNRKVREINFLVEISVKFKSSMIQKLGNWIGLNVKARGYI